MADRSCSCILRHNHCFMLLKEQSAPTQTVWVKHNCLQFGTDSRNIKQMVPSCFNKLWLMFLQRKFEGVHFLFHSADFCRRLNYNCCEVMCLYVTQTSKNFSIKSSEFQLRWLHSFSPENPKLSTDWKHSDHVLVTSPSHLTHPSHKEHCSRWWQWVWAVVSYSIGLFLLVLVSHHGECLCFCWEVLQMKGQNTLFVL